MKNHPWNCFLGSLLVFMVVFNACQPQPVPVASTPTTMSDSTLLLDQVHQHQLQSIRLGDGVPLTLQLAIRWKVNDPELFSAQFGSVEDYDQLILFPRAQELANTVSNHYTSVDSVFTSQRQLYSDDVKNELLHQLGEEGIQIKEVILAKIGFPTTYTKAMEAAGLQRQELERIEQQNIADLAKAKANRKKAEAEGKVAIAQAKAAGELQRIQAATEESRRASELAKAETQNQVAKMQAKAEAERRQLLAAADLKNKKALKDLELEQKRGLDQLAIQKEQQLAENQLDREMRFAQLCSQHPTYASYLVNKELASKVEIAVLPSNSENNVFTSIIEQMMPPMQKTKTGFTPK
ncbi:MAG: SPFH domain-containing protein [Bacteroidota bacterium]